MVKRFPMQSMLCIAAVFVHMILIGCGAPQATSNATQSYPQLRVVGILAGRYLSTNNGRPPQKREDLIKFLDGMPVEWKGLGMNTVDEFLTSPRDKQPLVILTGKQFGAMSSSGLPWVAYEQTGIDGKVLLINARGGVSEMPTKEAQQLFPQ